MKADEMLVIITHIHCACDVPSGGRHPSQIPQLYTLYIIDSLQLNSSDQSPQSLRPLHRSLATDRHLPVLRHMIWSARHATHTCVCHMRIKLPTHLLAADRHRLHCSLRWDHVQSLVFTCGGLTLPSLFFPHLPSRRLRSRSPFLPSRPYFPPFP